MLFGKVHALYKMKALTISNENPDISFEEKLVFQFSVAQTGCRSRGSIDVRFVTLASSALVTAFCTASDRRCGPFRLYKKTLKVEVLPSEGHQYL